MSWCAKLDFWGGRRYSERTLTVQRGVTNACLFHFVTWLQVFVMQALFIWLIGARPPARSAAPPANQPAR